MTQLSDKVHDAQMADMKSFDEQMPCVGIFWYDPEDRCFFGVHKKEITPREVEEAAEKGVPFISFGEQFQSDSSNQGGCVVWNADKFEVKVGHWAEPILEELTELPSRAS